MAVTNHSLTEEEALMTATLRLIFAVLALALGAAACSGSSPTGAEVERVEDPAETGYVGPGT